MSENLLREALEKIANMDAPTFVQAFGRCVDIARTALAQPKADQQREGHVETSGTVVSATALFTPGPVVWVADESAAEDRRDAERWIPVAEQLPSGWMQVWTYDTDNEVRVDTWDEDCFIEKEKNTEYFSAVAPVGSIGPARITHWMEMKYPSRPDAAIAARTGGK